MSMKVLINFLQYISLCVLKHINEKYGEEGQSSKWFKVKSSKQVSNEHDVFDEFLHYILFLCVT